MITKKICCVHSSRTRGYNAIVSRTRQYCRKRKAPAGGRAGRCQRGDGGQHPFASRRFGMGEASIEESRVDQSFDGAAVMAMAPTQCTEDTTVVPLVVVVRCSAHHDCLIMGDDSRHYQVWALSFLALRRIWRQTTASAQER